jgi:hypothetical protein
MEKKSANEIIRQIIREEITRALRTELPKIINESTKKVLPQQKRPDQPPMTLNSSPMVKFEDVKFKQSNNPLASLLNETAKDMLNENNTMHFSTNDISAGIHPTMAFQPREVTTGGVKDMLTTAIPSSNIDAVQINVVPDYSYMMEKMGIL